MCDRANDGFILPKNGGAHIWRYMDLAKFIRILHAKSLYFSTKKEFEDTFEGCLTTPSLKVFQEMTGLDGPHAKYVKTIVEDLANFAVSCWHMNEYEDYMMWSMYAKGRGLGGVAIRSTVERLRNAFSGSDPEVNIGMVKYIDYDNDSLDPSQLGSFGQWLLHKRMQFQAERELRAIVAIPRGSEHGIEIPCDVNTLIESVYVAPDSPGYVSEVVQSVCAKFGLSLAEQIQPSSLSEQPPHFRVVP